MPIRIKNWKRFQHFKDRRPPWIKLYYDLLEDPEWHKLDPLSSKVLVMLWMIASTDPCKEGTIPDVEKVAFLTRLPEKQISLILPAAVPLDHTGRYRLDITAMPN